MAVNEVIICGGGVDLLSDLEQCPKAIKISCNYHAWEVGIECEYAIYWHKEVERYIEGKETKRIYAKDYNGKRLRMFGYVGTAAVIFALEELKADKVYLAGFDLYTKGLYCHPGGNRLKSHQTKLENHKRWWNQLFEYLGHESNKILPISGPLVELCKQWSVVAHSA